MRTLRLWAAALVLLGPAAAAQDFTVNRAGRLGIGGVIGESVGATAKYWLSGSQALDAALGGDGGHPDFQADLLLHGWNLAQPSGGKLGLYAGVGLELEDDRGAGLRLPLGASFLPAPSPLELFAELVPTFWHGSELGWGVGLRYYW